MTDAVERITAPFEGHGNEEELLGEGEDDSAPRPPEMIAASFEEELGKPKIIGDDIGAPDPNANGQANEEELLEEVEDDDDEGAPIPPEMVAASFEEELGKSKVIGDVFGASDTGGQVDVPFEGRIHEERSQGR
jgi:hypothetical protein